MFQSTPLCEGRHRFTDLTVHVIEFQSTPLCEGRQSSRGRCTPQPLFQSTPLCEGRHTAGTQDLIPFVVSIHAPV